MRTKALLLGAIIGAASLAPSQAQVYSVNIVGYINLTVYRGWNLIANQLDNSAGNNIQNLIGSSFTGALGVFVYNGQTQSYNNINFDPELGWDGDLTVNPGQGFFLYNIGGPEFTLTLVGQVKTGAQDVKLWPGWNLVSLVVPQEGLLADWDATGKPNFGYPTATANGIFTYDGATQSYNNINFDAELGWDGPPNIKVGSGFFDLRSGAGADTTWSRTFTVSGN